jgi:hypothetical protein
MCKLFFQKVCKYQLISQVKNKIKIKIEIGTKEI